MKKNIELLTFDTESATQLSLIRNVGEKDNPITLLAFKKTSINKKSKYVTNIVEVNNWNENADRFIKDLISIGKKEPFKYLIISTSDLINTLIVEHYGELIKYFHFSFNRPEKLLLLIDKSQFYKEMSKLNVNIPSTYFFYSKNEVLIQIKKLGFPIIVKPNCMYDSEFHKCFNNKILKIYNEQQFNRYKDGLIQLYDKIIVQKLIKGDKNIATYGYFFKGEFLSACEYVKDNINSWGTTVIGHSKDDYNLRSYSKEILSKIGYEGFAELEFLYDEDEKQYKLLEINSRPVQWCRLCSYVTKPVETIPLDLINNKFIKEQNSVIEDKFVYYEQGLLELYKNREIELKTLFKYIHNKSAISMFYDKKDILPSIRIMLSFYKNLIKSILINK